MPPYCVACGVTRVGVYPVAFICNEAFVLKTGRVHQCIVFYIVDRFRLVDRLPYIRAFEPGWEKSLRDPLPDTVEEKRPDEAVPGYHLLFGFH